MVRVVLYVLSTVVPRKRTTLFIILSLVLVLLVVAVVSSASARAHSFLVPPLSPGDVVGVVYLVE